MKQGFLVAAIVAAGALSARADEIVLTNGHKIPNARRIDSKDPNRVIFEVGSGRIELDAKQVSSVNPGRTPLHEWDAKWAEVKDSKNAGDFAKLASWCKENKLHRYVGMLSERIVALDPANETAHKDLGHEKLDGVWYTHDQAMEKRGYAKVNDRWMTKAEVALIEKQRLEAKEKQAAREKAKADELERRAKEYAAYQDWYAKQTADLDGYFYQPSEFWPAYFRPYPWAPYVRSRRNYQYGNFGGGSYGGGALPTFDLFRFMPSPFLKK